MAAMIFFLVILCALSSCELQSLATPQETTDGASTVYQPVEITTTQEESPTTAETTTAPLSTTAPPTTTTAPQISYYNPLNGLPCEGVLSSRRPIALSVKTAYGSQIAAADLVIEAPTESAQTRLSLVGNDYASLLQENAIASTRPHLASLANDLFAISIYRGTSDGGRESTRFLYNTIDTETMHLEANEASLLSLIAEKGYQSTIAGSIALPYTLAGLGESVKPKKSPSTYVSIPFSDAAQTSFTYDSLTKSYTMRSCTALLQDTTLPTYSNLLILFYDATLRVTKDGTELTLDTEMGGNGYYISQGGVVPILWRRDGETSRLCFVDENGATLTINRGKTYIGMTTFAYREGLILN